MKGSCYTARYLEHSPVNILVSELSSCNICNCPSSEGILPEQFDKNHKTSQKEGAANSERFLTSQTVIANQQCRQLTQLAQL